MTKVTKPTSQTSGKDQAKPEASFIWGEPITGRLSCQEPNLQNILAWATTPAGVWIKEESKPEGKRNVRN